MKVVVTGAAGFIGSHLVRHLLTSRPEWQVVGLDALTYAGNLESLADLQRHPRFHFVKGDICDAEAVRGLFCSERIDGVFHLAAESHVDRSIAGPMAFVRTNVEGTATLLEAARAAWRGREGCRFLHVSTDEVFGSLGATGRFDESTPYQPHSPYSASKAASDHMVRAWHDTYGFPSLVTNCTNNYGPYQFPEKLIPLVLLRAGRGEVVPVYGKGDNVRDWLFVEDHCAALLRVFEAGELGGSYGIGGESECTNLALVELLLDLHDEAAGEPVGRSRKLISFVTDRPGHDFRYAMDISKMRRELGWSPRVSLRDGMAQTVAWYLANGAWTASVTTGAYRAFEQTWYATRAGGNETGEA
jgi:dTDP-glucose 4,6-dehydratase